MSEVVRPSSVNFMEEAKSQLLYTPKMKKQTSTEKKKKNNFGSYISLGCFCLFSPPPTPILSKWVSEIMIKGIWGGFFFFTSSRRFTFSSKSRTPMMPFRQSARQPTKPIWQLKKGSPIMSTWKKSWNHTMKPTCRSIYSEDYGGEIKCRGLLVYLKNDPLMYKNTILQF